MKILNWSELFSPYPGGIEVVFPVLLPRLAVRGFEFLVVTSHDYLALPDRDELAGIPVLRLPFRPALRARDVQQLARLREQVRDLVREFQPELIHLNGVGSSAVFLDWFLAGNDVPLMMTLHQTLALSSRSEDSVLRRLLGRTRWVIAVSRTLADGAGELMPALRERISVIYHVSEPAPPAPPVPDFQAPRLLAFGRLIPDKGFDVLLRALPAVRERVPSVRLTLASDGPERPALEALASELGLREIVTFTGFLERDALRALLSEASLVVVPSRKEGLPMTVVEAAQWGRPIAATTVGGIPEVIEHGQSGWLCPPDDPPALAESILTMLENPGRAVEMGWEARRRTAERFSLEAAVAAYENVFRAVRPALCSVPPN